MIKLIQYIDKHAPSLARLLSEDTVLKEKIGSDFSGDECDFHTETMEWINKKSSFTYSVLYNNKCIGLASIVPHSTDSSNCGLGYWIGSEFWNKGLGSLMFAELISLASLKQFHSASATIEKSNIPSSRLWLKYTPTIEPVDNNKSKYIITLFEKSKFR